MNENRTNVPEWVKDSKKRIIVIAVIIACLFNFVISAAIGFLIGKNVYNAFDNYRHYYYSSPLLTLNGDELEDYFNSLDMSDYY